MSDKVNKENVDALTAENARLRNELLGIWAVASERSPDDAPDPMPDGAVYAAVDAMQDREYALDNAVREAFKPDLVGEIDQGVTLTVEHISRAITAKVDALTRTVAALRAVLVTAHSFIASDLDNAEACVALESAIQGVLASPDVAGPADAWVSRAEHDRVVAAHVKAWESAHEGAKRMGEDFKRDAPILLDSVTKAHQERDAARRDLRERDQTIAMLREQRVIDGEKIAALEAEARGENE